MRPETSWWPAFSNLQLGKGNAVKREITLYDPIKETL
jgi:hypothetical protein